LLRFASADQSVERNVEPYFELKDLPGMLNSPDANENIQALQFLINNLGYVNDFNVAESIKKLTQSKDIGVRFWAKKLSNAIGKYETDQANAQVASVSKDLPVEILIQKLKSVASTYLSLDVIKKLCESKKPEALDYLKTYLSSCKDSIQISYLTKNIGVYFPTEDNLMFLMPFLKSEDDRVVANTIEGIAAIGSHKGVVVLSQLLDHKSNRVRTNAAIAIRNFDAEKSFTVISKMLDPESGAHFRISACHAIKTMRDSRFLEQLEPALLDDTTFSAALDSIEAIGGQLAISMLTKNYSKFQGEKQTKIDQVAANLSRLEKQPIEKIGKKILSSNFFSRFYFEIEDSVEKLQTKLGKAKKTCKIAIKIMLFFVLAIAVCLFAWKRLQNSYPNIQLKIGDTDYYGYGVAKDKNETMISGQKIAKQRVFDEAELLNASEKELLQVELDKISQVLASDFIVVTQKQLSNDTIQQFANRFFDSSFPLCR